MMCNLRLCLVSISMIAVSILQGAETPEDYISADLTVLNWDKGVISDLKYLSDQKVETIEIYSRGLSSPTHYSGPQRLDFFRESKIPGSDELERHVVASVNIPSGISEVLLIFMKDRKADAERYNVIAIKRDRSSFSKGCYQIYNLSDFPVSGKLGDSLFKLDYHGNKVIYLPQQDKTSIEVKFAQEEEGQWQLGYSSVWSHYAGKRVNIFILNSENSISPIDVRRFSEYVQDNAPAEQP